MCTMPWYGVAVMQNYDLNTQNLTPFFATVPPSAAAAVVRAVGAVDYYNRKWMQSPMEGSALQKRCNVSSVYRMEIFGFCVEQFAKVSMKITTHTDIIHQNASHSKEKHIVWDVCLFVCSFGRITIHTGVCEKTIIHENVAKQNNTIASNAIIHFICTVYRRNGPACT